MEAVTHAQAQAGADDVRAQRVHSTRARRVWSGISSLVSARNGLQAETKLPTSDLHDSAPLLYKGRNKTKYSTVEKVFDKS
mgnify:CR=1 FL=1